VTSFDRPARVDRDAGRARDAGSISDRRRRAELSSASAWNRQRYDDKDKDDRRHHRRHKRFVSESGGGDFYDYNYYDDYYYPSYYLDPAVADCVRRFKTYDRVSRTYIGRRGLRYACP
jgi:hypothetical protein